MSADQKIVFLLAVSSIGFGLLGWLRRREEVRHVADNALTYDVPGTTVSEPTETET